MPANPPEPAPDAEKPVSGQQQRKAGPPKTFAGLAVGDVVLFQHGYAQYQTPKPVERLTKTQLIVSGVKFNRRTGYAVGWSVWGGPSIEIATPEKIAAAEAKNRQDALARKAEAFRGWESLSTETLEAVLKLIQP